MLDRLPRDVLFAVFDHLDRATRFTARHGQKWLQRGSAWTAVSHSVLVCGSKVLTVLVAEVKWGARTCQLVCKALREAHREHTRRKKVDVEAA